MKKVLVLLVAVALLMGMMATGTSAQSGISYAVGVQIKNLDDDISTATTVMYYRQSDGAMQSSLDVPDIPANGSFTMAELQGVDVGFNGSAVISSDNRIAAIANVFGNGTMGASYSAFSGGETTASLPLILRNHYGFNTWFNVQNVGSGAATTVTVTYSNGATESATIQPGAAKTFKQDTNTALPDPSGSAGFVGSATLTSSGGQPIVATLLEQGPTTLLGYDSFRSSDATTSPVMPLVNTNNYGYQTGIQIQNTGNASTDVTITYTPSQAGTACTETLSVPAQGSSTFADVAFRTNGPNETCANGATFIGSARVTTNTTNQPLVAIVNQLNQTGNKGASYGGFNPNNATSTVELPLIMDRNYLYWTGYAIANVGTAATTVTCTYTNNSKVDSATVQPGGSLTVQNLNQLADGYVGAATCVASSGGQIVGVVNELQNGSSTDSFLVYEGTNR